MSLTTPNFALTPQESPGDIWQIWKSMSSFRSFRIFCIKLYNENYEHIKVTQITVVCFWWLLQTKWLVQTGWLLYIPVRLAIDKVEHVSRDACLSSYRYINGLKVLETQILQIFAPSITPRFQFSSSGSSQGWWGLRPSRGTEEKSRGDWAPKQWPPPNSSQRCHENQQWIR